MLFSFVCIFQNVLQVVFCLTISHKMYSAICDLCTQLDIRWQEQFCSVLD